MKKWIPFIAAIVLLGFSSCSGDDDNPIQDSDLLVNGETFPTGINGSETYNIMVSQTGPLTVEIRENGGQGRTLGVMAAHAADTQSGTYEVENNEFGEGLAILYVLDSEGNQIAGGSVNDPSGTVTIVTNGGRNYTLTFNDVVLDPDTPSQTTITGSVTKTFRAE
jgi:hypothetical protein